MEEAEAKLPLTGRRLTLSRIRPNEPSPKKWGEPSPLQKAVNDAGSPH